MGSRWLALQPGASIAHKFLWWGHILLMLGSGHAGHRCHNLKPTAIVRPPEQIVFTLKCTRQCPLARPITYFGTHATSYDAVCYYAIKLRRRRGRGSPYLTCTSYKRSCTYIARSCMRKQLDFYCATTKHPAIHKPYRQTGIQTYRQADSHTDIQTDRHTYVNA